MSEKENDRSDFENKLQAVLEKRFEGFEKLLLCRRLSAGASQETYRIVISTHTGKRQLAMRRSIKGVGSLLILGAAGLATEAKLFLRAKEAGVPEPEVFYVTAPEDGVGDAFIMEWLEGETLGSRIVRSESLKNIRPKLAYQCGQILARIHALDLEETGLGKRLVRINPEDAIDMGWNRYKSFKTAQPTIDYTARWLKEHLPESSRTTLVHGDFRNGNLIVSPLGVIAVLDWEAAHIGDPMRDLGWLCTNSWRFGLSDLPVGGFGDYNDLFRGYEDESGLTIDPDHVKFWEVFGSFLWAGGCLGMAEIFRSGVDNSVERPAIGRRTSECQVDCVNLLIPGPVKLVRKKNRDEISSDLPRIDELVLSVRDFLRTDVMDQTQNRTNFMARVAANSLDIVLRDIDVGDVQRQEERKRLRTLLSTDGNLETLRWKLVNGLRNGSIPLNLPGLKEHLRHTVVNQVAIDQPGYSGLKIALQAARR